MRVLPTCLLLTFSLALHACATSRPLPPGGPTPRRSVRIVSETPFPLHLVGAPTGTAPCMTTRFEGVVTSVRGDTIQFGTIYEVAAPWFSRACASRGTPFILSSETTGVTMVARTFSPGRTAGMLLIGVPLIGIGLIAILCTLQPCLA